MVATLFTASVEAQNRTTVNAMSDEISDNLDLRAVASIFGDSRNLEDFERRLNDPELQISNLDLNNDNEVDYLRVIETVEYNTHVVIIQAVLDRDVYQDVATVDIERNNNSVQVQFIGNEYLYGPNYIYEPVYYATPQIYASFWISNYRPYISSWYWNYYPSYYYAWNPYPVYRYRNNISLCLNFSNRYNYVSYRRSNLAISLYNTRRSNAYERRYPNYAFTRRYSNYSNRYELDQRRGVRNYNNYSSNRYTPGRTYSNNTTARRETQRDYSPNRNSTSRVYSTPRTSSRESNNSSSNTAKTYTPSRNYSQNNNNYSKENTQRPSNRNYNQNNTYNSRQNTPQQTESSRTYSPRQQNGTPRVENNRESSSNRGTFSRPTAPASIPQRVESNKSRSQNSRENNSSRSNNRRI